MVPRAVLRLSSWWFLCSGKEAQIGRSGNDWKVIWMRCGGGSPDAVEFPLACGRKGSVEVSH